MIKHLFLNDGNSKKVERFVILYRTISENEKITRDTFNKNALSSVFQNVLMEIGIYSMYLMQFYTAQKF